MNKETKSKTMKELYDERYSRVSVLENPLLITEAIGYLKCLKQFTQDVWIDNEIKRWNVILKTGAILGVWNND